MMPMWIAALNGVVWAAVVVLFVLQQRKIDRLRRAYTELAEGIECRPVSRTVIIPTESAYWDQVMENAREELSR